MGHRKKTNCFKAELRIVIAIVIERRKKEMKQQTETMVIFGLNQPNKGIKTLFYNGLKNK